MSGDDHGHTGEAHDCDTCADCIHDGRKCCGCYDGACCQSPAWSDGPQHSCVTPDPNCWRCDIAPPVEVAS